ncbi:MAG: dethiobiotin synthase [Gammaproteobacteria bacterium]|nr:dethiobiotin synthase [Gammaproteobacteria bacterium]
MQGVFITGTDTGVGKTRIGVLLAKALYKKNIRVIPRKPVESGCKTMTGALIPADALALKQAAHYEGELREVCPYRFSQPVSPVRAAQLSNTKLTTEQLVKACQHDDEEGFTLVEGAGGFYLPISEDGLNADLAMALKLPVLLVAEDKLGALNQVLLNMEALDMCGLDLVGIVLNNLDNNRDRHMDNAADLRARLDCAVFKQNYCGNISDDLVNAVIALPAKPVAKLVVS